VLSIVKQCQKEILEVPEEVRRELADAITRIEEGQVLSMPLSRPVPSIGKGVHELRFRDRAGIYGVIYFLAGRGVIYLLHAFAKKTQKTSSQDIEVAKRRLREVL
jgi:phage-related protein